MILTVTLNAALDVTYRVPRLEPGAVHRVAAVHRRAGGKGVNVAMVLHALGHEVLVTGLAGGPTGAALLAELARAGLPHVLVEIAEDTRRTVTVVDGGGATAFNEPGPPTTPAEWTNFLATYEDLVRRARVVVLSGSLPARMPVDAYAQLLRLAAGVPVILDSSGDALRAGLAARPTVVKPNADELAGATAVSDPWEAATSLRHAGAGAVVASLGADGLLALTPAGAWKALPPLTMRGNPTGAGDACVAAIAAGLATGATWPDLLADAVALSAAAVGAPVAGEVDLATYRRLRPHVELEEHHAHADR